MSSRQYFPMHEPGQPDRLWSLDAASKSKSSVGASAEQEQRHAVESIGTLAVLGLARVFEWQATATHVMLTEWTRQQEDWLGVAMEAEHALRHWGLSRAHLERALDAVRLWGMWGVATQFALAHGLMSSCNPRSLGLPATSGRRAGFDLGRRAAATVIAFPDRRRAGH